MLSAKVQGVVGVRGTELHLQNRRSGQFRTGVNGIFFDKKPNHFVFFSQSKPLEGSAKHHFFGVKKGAFNAMNIFLGGT